MYTHRASHDSHDARPLENLALLNAVRHISGSLIHRAGITARHTPFATLLAQIWGESRYATIEVLVEKRLRKGDVPKKKLRKSKVEDVDLSVFSGDERERERKGVDDQGERVRRRRNAGRDELVRILRRVQDDDLTINERKLTLNIVNREGVLDIDALRRLWAVPKVIFEVSELDQYFRGSPQPAAILDFYQAHIMRETPDSRIFNILYWKENYDRDAGKMRATTLSKRFRTITKGIIGTVIKLLLTKRRSAFYEKNMLVVVETVLYAIHPDRFIHQFREAALREAGFFLGLQSYEYSRSFTGALENLHLGKLNRMLKDIRAVRGIDGIEPSKPTNPPHPANPHPEKQEYVSLGAINKYCADRDTLTERALQGIYNRYVRRHTDTADNTGDNTDDTRMPVADFVRIYLALIGCGTDQGLKYWFSVLDQDGDGWVGVSDVAHFYAQRKRESETRNGILLADMQSLWIRLCAMLGVPPHGKGLDLHSLQELGREEREFVMCALLVRRADDGNLTNVAATVSRDSEAARAL